MNYYNPYYMFYPISSFPRPGLFGTLRNSIRGINFGNILNGTQRTLNLINQAIPLVKQVTPVMRNAKTMFRVMNEFKKTDLPNRGSKNGRSDSYGMIDEAKDDEGPTFFV